MKSNKTFDDEVILLATTIIQDEYANEVETEVQRTLLCNEESVGRNEFYNAARAGLKPTLIITIKYFEYEGEKRLIYKGKHYQVDRTYSQDKEDIELICSEATV